MINFTIPGEPKGKGRPKFTRMGHTYTPKETANYENWVRTCFINANQPKLQGALKAEINCYMSIPKSVSKKARQAMIDKKLFPTKKPDIDNIVKIILDSLNGFAYDDDKNITSCSVNKYYSETPRVDVDIRIIQGD